MKLEGSEVMRRVKKREKCLKKQEDGETCALRLRQTEREGEEAGAGGRGGGGKKSDSPTAAPNGSSGAEREEGSAEEEERKE